MTLPNFAKDRDALLEALEAYREAGRRYRRGGYGADVIALLRAVRDDVAEAFPEGWERDFRDDMQLVIDNAEYAFEQDAESAGNWTLGEGERLGHADYGLVRRGG